MDPVDTLFLIVIGSAVLALIMNFVMDASSESATEIPRAKLLTCKRHEWSTNPKTERLECVNCSYVAGTHVTDNGDY